MDIPELIEKLQKFHAEYPNIHPHICDSERGLGEIDALSIEEGCWGREKILVLDSSKFDW
jgi:hypothetical protein